MYAHSRIVCELEHKFKLQVYEEQNYQHVHRLLQLFVNELMIRSRSGYVASFRKVQNFTDSKLPSQDMHTVRTLLFYIQTFKISESYFS